MARHKNALWNLDEKNPGFDGAKLAALMDVRDELQTNNRLMQELIGIFRCHNAQDIPRILRRIDKRLQTNLPLKKGRPNDPT